jgi:circadian clock protein KaiC
LPIEGASSLVENILLTRFIEQRGRLIRIFSVTKTRDSAYDHAVRELLVGDDGIALGAPIEGSFGAQHNVPPGDEGVGALRGLRHILRKRGRTS